MKQLIPPTNLTFYKREPQVPKIFLQENSPLLQGIYSIPIDPAPASGVLVRIRIKSPELRIANQNAQPLHIQVALLNLKSRDPLEILQQAGGFFHLNVGPMDHMIEQQKDCRVEISEDFLCNTVAVYCEYDAEKLPAEIEISFEVYDTVPQIELV